MSVSDGAAERPPIALPESWVVTSAKAQTLLLAGEGVG